MTTHVYVASEGPDIQKLGVSISPRERKLTLRREFEAVFGRKPREMRFVLLSGCPSGAEAARQIEQRALAMLGEATGDRIGEWRRCTVSDAIAAVQHSSRDLNIPLVDLGESVEPRGSAIMTIRIDLALRNAVSRAARKHQRSASSYAALLIMRGLAANDEFDPSTLEPPNNGGEEDQ